MKSHANRIFDLEVASELDARFEADLGKMLEKTAAESKFPKPTVGVEQEFFVVKEDTSGGQPILASLSDTQRLLRRLGDTKGWRVIENKANPSRRVISRVSREHSCNRYTSVKYEFPPHLMEIAFTYFENLDDLVCEIEDTWKDIEASAAESGLKILLCPFISPPEIDLDAQTQVDPKLALLANSRKDFYLRRGEPVDPIAVNFPPIIIADNPTKA